MEELINNIYQEIELIENLRVKIQDNYSEISRNTSKIYSEIIQPKKAFHNLQSKATELKTSIIPLVQDIELHITEGYIEESLERFVKKNYEFILDDIRLTLERNSPVRLILANGINSDNFVIQSKWSVLNDSNNVRQDLIIRFYLTFKISENILKPKMIRRSTFHKFNLNETDPLRFLPVLRKEKALNDLDNSLSKIIEGFVFSFDDYQVGSSLLKFHPKISLTYNNKLFVFSKSMPKRKIPFPVDFNDVIYNHQFLLKVRKEHIMPIIKDIAKSRDAKLLSAEFYNNRIHIESYGKKKKDIFHISVTGRVWMKHNIYLSDGFNSLNFDAYWSSWRYRIKAKRCLGFCSKVMREAKKRALNIIQSSLYFSGKFMSTENLGNNVKVKIDYKGIKFYFNKTIR